MKCHPTPVEDSTVICFTFCTRYSNAIYFYFSFLYFWFPADEIVRVHACPGAAKSACPSYISHNSARIVTLFARGQIWHI